MKIKTIKNRIYLERYDERSGFIFYNVYALKEWFDEYLKSIKEEE